MAQGKRLHLSYERMVMLVDGCPAFKDTANIKPDIMHRVQSISYAFSYNSVRNTEIGSTEYIKHRTFNSATITNASDEMPIVIASADHGLKTGDEVSVSDVSGNTAANGTFTITKVDDDNFSLNGSKGNSAYISGGTWEASKSRIPIISQPTVSLDFNYLLYDATNERKIGFNVGPQGFLNYEGSVTPNKLYSRPNWNGSNFDLVPDKGDLNFYILADDTNARKDIVGNRGFMLWSESKAYVIHNLVRYQGRIFKCLVAHTSSSTNTPPTSDTDNINWKFEYAASRDFEGMDVLGFGNCYLSNYSINIAVGSFINCSTSYLCSNLTYDIFDSSKDLFCPAVDGNGERSDAIVDIPFTEMRDQFVENPNDKEETLVLRPGDIQVDLINNKPLSDGGFHLMDLSQKDTSIESITFNLPIQRKDINGFGSNYINDRKMQFPIMCTAEMTILTRNFEGLGDISRIFKDDVDCDIVASMIVRKEITDTMPGPPDNQGSPTLLKDHFTKSKYIIQERIKITAKNAKLDNESHSFQVGGFAKINVSFLFEVTPEGGFIVESSQ